MSLLEGITEREFVSHMQNKFGHNELFANLATRYLLAITDKISFPKHRFLSPAYQVLGVDPNEYIDKGAIDLVHVSSYPIMGATFMKKLIALASGNRGEDEIDEYELNLKSEEGPLPIKGSAWPIKENGEHTKIFYVAKLKSDSNVPRYSMFRDALKEGNLTHKGLLLLYSEVYKKAGQPCPIQPQLSAKSI